MCIHARLKISLTLRHALVLMKLGQFCFWFAIGLCGNWLINKGLDVEPFNGQEHPWLDDVAGWLQQWGGWLKNLSRKMLGFDVSIVFPMDY